MSMKHYPIADYGVLISEADINEYAKSESVDIETAKELLIDDFRVSYEGEFTGSAYEISEVGETVYKGDPIYYFHATMPTPFYHPYKDMQDMEKQMLDIVQKVFPFRKKVCIVSIIGFYCG